jgi:uncharacterized protein YeaO (DUF488 family)
MFLPASVSDLTHTRLTRRDGFIAIVMRHHPRGVKVQLRDLYSRELAPSDELFKDFRAELEKTKDHNLAFQNVKYEERFNLSPEALRLLEDLNETAKVKDVYLVCQCGPKERCHRDLLLLLARKKFNAKTAPLRHEYEVFRRRLENDEF